MKDFSNAAFPPEVIEIMTAAFDAAAATLPEPVHLAHITIIASPSFAQPANAMRPFSNGSRWCSFARAARLT